MSRLLWRSRQFGMGFAIGFGTAAAFQVYTAVTGFTGIQPGPGGSVVEKGAGAPAATQGANNIGLANLDPAMLQAAQGSLCCYEGSQLMTAAGMVPDVNAMAGFHDFLTDANHLGMNMFTNVPTMLPSYALSLAAGVNQLTVGDTTFSLTVPLLMQMRVR